MKLKSTVRYRVNIPGKWADLSAALMGAAFFLQALYFFLIRDLSACSIGEIVLRLILPLSFAMVWILLLRIVPLRAPRLFGMAAAVLSVLLAIQGFFDGNIFWAVLGLIWYLVTAAALIFVCFGYLPYRGLLALLFLLPAVLRCFVALGTHIVPGDYWQGLPDYAGILVHFALLCLPTILKPVKR